MKNIIYIILFAIPILSFKCCPSDNNFREFNIFNDSYSEAPLVGNVFMKNNGQYIRVANLDITPKIYNSTVKKKTCVDDATVNSINKLHKIEGVDLSVKNNSIKNLSIEFNGTQTHEAALTDIGLEFQNKKEVIKKGLMPFADVIEDAFIVVKAVSSNDILYSLNIDNKGNAAVNADIKKIVNSTNTLTWDNKEKNKIQYKGDSQLFFAYVALPINLDLKKGITGVNIEDIALEVNKTYKAQ